MSGFNFTLVKNILFILLLPVSLSASAQKVRIGLKLGTNISNQLISDYPSQRELIGFHTGISSNFKISNRFSIQPELLYSQKGLKFGGGFTRLDYIEVPVLCGFQLKNFKLLAGFYYNSQVWLKVEDDYNSLKRSEFASNIGVVLGFEFALSDDFQIGARYQRDLFYSLISTGTYPRQAILTNGIEDPNIPNNNFDVGKMRVFQAYLSYVF